MRIKGELTIKFIFSSFIFNIIMPECIYEAYSYSSWLSPLSRRDRRVISRQSRFILFLLLLHLIMQTMA